MSDPLDPGSQDALAMTHQPSPPDPGQRYLDMIRRGAAATGAFAQGGVTGVMQQQGVQLPEWSNKVGHVLQSEAANTAIGMASPLKGASVARGLATIAKEAVPLAERVKGLGGDWANRPVIDTQGNVIHNPITSEHVSGPILRLNEDGTLSKGILAYHGSPHDFDRFDLSRIGTGEGAQAYGHGLYFAENEGVAKDYRTTLANWPTTVREIAGQNLSDDAVAAILQGRAANPGNPTRAAVVAQWRSQELRSIPNETIEKAIKGVDERERPGRMYQVSINADPEHFLDWDKPLNEQGRAGEKILSLLKEKGLVVDPKRTVPDALQSLESLKYGSQQKLSEALRQAGIPGIRYLDQGSRTGGEGTRNYVVFDDKTIDILKKYGLAGALGGGLGASQIQDSDPLAR